MNVKSKYLQIGTFSLALLMAGAPAATAASLRSADVVVIVDESGSMQGEHDWARTTIPLLD
ncbi:MAG: PEP-CTERM sorting domain-containing protein, partial [Okeania sp. SIO2H7]|nr:PEP-CTERM sorting domain-containing protein [Okeania sp. SIO2H7]